jgi:prepilin-type N-terminal cleavage/methylation domain-containing protein
LIPHARAKEGRRHSARGFTLVELTVALVAGLIVALGIVGLSREATRSFHEEVRSSAAEATLRTATDRLRADLQRAAYMSTGNIMGDPLMTRVPTDTSPLARIASTMKGLRRLAGVYLIDGGSANSNGLTLSALQSPAVTPDQLDIGGNFTCADQFEVQRSDLPSGSCQRLWLSTTDPSLYRVNGLGPYAQSQTFRNLWQPVPSSLSTQFIVRLIDDTGHFQYLATCAEQSAAGVAGIGASPQAWVDVDVSATPLLTAAQTKTLGGVTGNSIGRINPVQIVRWEIQAATNEPAQYQNALGTESTSATTVDPLKYDLVRSFEDALGKVIPETTEVVAEYAVDFEIAFSVETGDVTGMNPQTTTFAFDDASSAKSWGFDVSSVNPFVPGQGPQRVRSVRARLVTRTAQPDRTVNVPVSPQFSSTAAFMYRYCLKSPCTTADSVLRWARTRTVTTEVALPNQARMFY